MNPKTVICTHHGFMGMCPVLFTNFDSNTPTIIPPRWFVWWLRINLWIYEQICWWGDFFNLDMPNGYVFWGVYEFEEPLEIQMELEES